MKIKCKRCIFWSKYNTGEEGECKRHPPQIIMTEYKDQDGGAWKQADHYLPTTHRDSFCGDGE